MLTKEITVRNSLLKDLNVSVHRYRHVGAREDPQESSLGTLSTFFETGSLINVEMTY